MYYADSHSCTQYGFKYFITTGKCTDLALPENTVTLILHSSTILAKSPSTHTDNIPPSHLPLGVVVHQLLVGMESGQMHPAGMTLVIKRTSTRKSFSVWSSTQHHFSSRLPWVLPPETFVLHHALAANSWLCRGEVNRGKEIAGRKYLYVLQLQLVQLLLSYETCSSLCSTNDTPCSAPGRSL